MKKEFDFNMVGNRMPYSKEDIGLEGFEERCVKGYLQRRKNRRYRVVVGFAAAIIAVALSGVILLRSSSSFGRADAGFESFTQSLSNEELEIISNIYSVDVIGDENIK